MALTFDASTAEQLRRSIAALKSHCAAPVPVFVAVNTKSPWVKTKDYIPRVIPLSHALDKLENKSILLVTKDPSTPYRGPLTDKGSPTEDVFNEIYTVSKLKKIAAKPAQLTRLFKEFDLVVADHRVHKLLPEVLGAQFYVKNKKVPFVLHMAPPSADARLVKTARSHKLKDERCEPKFVKAQVRSIAKNTYCLPPANGTFAAIKFGYSDWPTAQLQKNFEDVVTYLTQERSGLLYRKPIESVAIKSSDSISLPVYKEAAAPDTDTDSEVDF